MNNYIFRLNGIASELYQPKELEALEVVADFENSVQPAITANELTFINEAAEYINNYIDNAVNGGSAGIFEGLPFEIQIQGSTNIDIFKGYLDLLQIDRKCDEVKVKLVSEDSLEKFNERCQATTFGYLESIGLIPQSIQVSVPYVVNYIPDGLQIIMIEVSLYLMAKELYETVPKIQAQTTAVITAATPTIGVPPSINISGIIIEAARLALLLVYTVLIIIAIKKLIQELITQIYSVKRYHKGVKVKELLMVACQYLGYTFSSSIFATGQIFDKLVFLPYKTKKGNIAQSNSDSGVPNSGGYGYTVFEIFELVANMFNAKRLIKGNTIYLESKANLSFWQLNSTYILPNIEVLNKSYNTDELYPNLYIRFDYDIADMNTIDNFKGTNYERITSPIIVNNKKHLNFGGLREVSLNVCLATRKDSVNTVESLLQTLAGIVDGLTSALGFNSNFVNSFQDRIGSMQVSQHFGWQPKVLLFENGKVSTSNRTFLSAKSLYHTFYEVDSFVANNYGGQYELYKDVIIPFCLHDFLQIINNSHFQTSNGLWGKFDLVHWNFTQGYAKVNYRIQKPYTTNVQEIYIEPE